MPALWQGTKGAYCPSTLILDYPWAIIRDEMRGCRLLLKSAHVRVGAQQSLLGPAYTQELGTIHGPASRYDPPLAAQRRRSTVPKPAVPKPKKTIAKVRASPAGEIREGQLLKVQAAYFRQYQRRVERGDTSGAAVSAGHIGEPGQLTKKANKAARRSESTSGRQGNTALRPARRFSLDAPLDFYLHLDFYLCTFQHVLNKSYNPAPNLHASAMLRDLPGVHRKHA